MTEQDETVKSPDDSFLTAAVAHALVSRAKANAAREHAKGHGIAVVDAVLSLSLMDVGEIDAAQILSVPRGFAPGYEIIGLIGSGASGNIFRARQTALQRDVALKTIKHQAPATFASRMQREAEAIARLKHPNIVVAYESGFAQGRFFIAMELVEGGTLYDFIQREAPVNESVAWQIIRQAAAGLLHADEAGIIHRDIKPANLLLATAPAGSKLPSTVPFVKVADFGLARDYKDEPGAGITKTGIALGTPAYVAPEQLDDTAVDCRADIYALGATTFHLLSGKMPCADQSPMKAILQKTAGNDDWRNELSEFVSSRSTQLFRDMTATDPDQRIANYEELIDRIDELVLAGDDASDVTQELVLTDVGSATDRWRRALFPAVLTLAAMLSVFTFKTMQSKRSENILPSLAMNEAMNWQPVAQPQPLFNGFSVPLRPVVLSGNWNPTSTEDGSLVLRGKEHSTFTVPLKQPNAKTDNTRLRLSVRGSSPTGVIELEVLGLNSAGQSDARYTPIGKLVVTHQECRVSSPAESQAAAVRKLSAPQSMEQPFRRIQLDRVGGRVLASVNGQKMAEWAVPDSGSAQLLIRCAAGDALLADIDIVELD